MLSTDLNQKGAPHDIREVHPDNARSCARVFNVASKLVTFFVELQGELQSHRQFTDLRPGPLKFSFERIAAPAFETVHLCLKRHPPPVLKPRWRDLYL